MPYLAHNEFVLPDGAPIPIDVHYDALKFVDENVRNFLTTVEKDWYLIGLKVGYRLYDDVSGDFGEEYKLSFGYLGEDACMTEVEVSSEEEWAEIVAESQAKNPIPIDFSDEMYDVINDRFLEIADRELAVDIFGIIAGSSSRCWGVGCYCRRRRTRRYYYYSVFARQCKSYCTTREC